MADRRSQMSFGQMAQQGPNPGFNAMAGPNPNQFVMMSQQQQQMALMQQQQQQQQMAQQGMMSQGAAMVHGGNPMMQQQPNPMMHPVNPMMQQNMLQQQQFPAQMFPGQMQQQMPMGMYMQGHFMAPGFPPGGAGVGSGQRFRPPAYTPQMAQEFKHKTDKFAVRQAKQLEGQRKRAEAELKARMFQEQQKRLKEFSAIGGRKMDADSLIKHIIGPDTKGRSAGASQQQAAPERDNTEADDGFGDFITGPTVQDFTQSGAMVQSKQLPQQPQPPANKQAPTVSTSAGSQGDAMETESQSQPQSQSQLPGQPNLPVEAKPASSAPQAKEEKKDIEKMMFASCDLTVPQKARTFQKRTLVKDAPKKVRSVTYQVSQKSREWTTETDNLSDLFTLPGGQPSPAAQQPVVAQGQVPEEVQGQSAASQGQGQVAGQVPVAGTLPPWCTGEVPPPELYSMVLEATTREGKIQTDLVYPILLRSGLSREVLGAIWGLANRSAPGQLIPPELCAILAAVALAQNNVALPNLELLHRLPAAPIPNLGQHAPPDGSTTALAPPGGATSNQPVLPAVGAVIQGPGAATVCEGDEDFSEFQEAPVGVPPSDSFGEFIIASPVNSTNTLPGAAPVRTSPDVLIGEEDKYSVLKVLAPGGSTGADLGSTTRTKDLQETAAVPSPSGRPSTFQPPTQPDVSAFMGLPPPKNALTSPEFTDFQSAAQTEEDDFADFQQAVGTVGLSGSNNQDKLAALRALISDKSLYQAKQEDDASKNLEASEGAKANEKESWPAFTSNTEENIKNKFDGFSSAIDSQSSSTDLFQSELAPPPNVFGGSILSGQPSGVGGMFPDQPEEEWSGFTGSDQGGENWAKFNSNEPKSSEDSNWQQTGLDWNAGPIMNSTKIKTTEAQLQGFDSTKSEEGKPGGLFATKLNKEPQKPQPNNKKKFNYFAHNIENTGSGVAAGTGMSPLDFQPPELPDMKDEDVYDDDFDKFGTFRAIDSDITVGTVNGLSSLGAPFGGLDEYGDPTSGCNNIEGFSYNSRPRKQTQPQKDTTDTVSISSNEFTGWKTSTGKSTKESDSQSVSSLDLTTIKPPKSSKDGSPVGGDSQSVSSLEFGAVDRKAVTPADEQSVASLELKAISPEDAPSDTMLVREPEDDTFGEFSSATDGPKPGFMAQSRKTEYVQCPRKASELLTTGDMPSIGDRYSSLVENREDADRHVFDWQRCLDYCRAMLEEAARAFSSIQDPRVCEEVLHSQQGTQYIQGVVEIYRVACRITESMRAVSVTNAKLVELLKAIDRAWLDFVTLLSDTPLKPTPGQLDFSGAVLKAEEDGSQEVACGVCLLNVNARPKRPLGVEEDNHKLTYGGRQYHASCANFWVNCVDSMLPALKIPELL